MGGRTPDFRGQFLRGLDAGHSVGERVQDTFKSHAHGQPAHTHSWNGQLASTALTGTAAGQEYVDLGFGAEGSYDWGTPYGVPRGDGSHGYTLLGNNLFTRNAKASAVTGRLSNGTVNGTVSSGGGDDTYATGDAETAPRHVYVRYFIRAKP